VHGTRTRGAGIENTAPYSVLVPAELGDISERERLFVLGKLLSRVVFRTFLVDRRTPRDTEIIVAAAVRASGVADRFGEGLTSEEFLEEQARRIKKALPRKVR